MRPELTILGIFAVTVIVAVLVGRDAHQRGLQAIPWALLTLFVPIVGAGVYMFTVKPWRRDRMK